MPEQARIKFKNQGFWIPEEYIEVLCTYICSIFETEGLSNFSENLKKMYLSCDGNRSGVHSGMVSILLDDYITNETDKNTFFNVLQQTKILISLNGAELSIAELNEIENGKEDDYFKIEWQFPIKTQSLLSTIDIIEQLLNGIWPHNNRSIHYVGFPNPGGFEEI